MAIIFEFETDKGFHFANAFADRFDVQVMNDRVNLPEWLGNGFIQEVYLSSGLALCIHSYTLKQKLILKRLATTPTAMLTMKFDCRKLSSKNNNSMHDSLFADGMDSEVELGSSNFFSELIIPADQEILFLVVGTTRQTLTELLNLGPQERWIEHTLKDNQSFVLYESMTHEMERILKQISQITQTTGLTYLLYQAKVQELIYLLFTKLISRRDNSSITLNQADAKKIHQVRAAILADLSLPPQLPELAAKVGMSLTKMKQLFNQVFGKSIYNYYQAARMAEAADLLAKLSVSETGYKIGFTNLSHFTRLFEKHHQIKPKRFKDALKMV